MPEGGIPPINWSKKRKGEEDGQEDTMRDADSDGTDDAPWKPNAQEIAVLQARYGKNFLQMLEKEGFEEPEGHELEKVNEPGKNVRWTSFDWRKALASARAGREIYDVGLDYATKDSILNSNS